MAKGKTVTLFLMDGDPKKRIKCTLANWTGVAYKIPRTEIEHAKNINYLTQTGVYLLFSTSDETQENIVYIGQAGTRKNGEGVLNRLQEHKRSSEKDYWTEAVIFTTTNNSFGPTEISYLENKFTRMAVSAKRYIVKNGNEPNIGNVTEEKEAELEEFTEFAKIVIGSLGYRVFEPLVEEIDDSLTQVNESNHTLILNRKPRNSKQVIAYGEQTSEGFVVLKGSYVSERLTKTEIGKYELEKRQTSKLDEHNLLLENILFKSPSAAAQFVLGHSANGKTAWKNHNGLTLNELEKLDSNNAK